MDRTGTTEYYGVYYVLYGPEGNAYFVSAMLFYPEYYCSLYIKVYNFNREAVTDEKP